jgi:hypothetical protein
LGIFIKGLSGIAHLVLVVDDGEAVPLLSFQVLPPDDADPFLFQFLQIGRIIGPVLVEESSYPLFRGFPSRFIINHTGPCTDFFHTHDYIFVSFPKSKVTIPIFGFITQ